MLGPLHEFPQELATIGGGLPEPDVPEHFRLAFGEEERVIVIMSHARIGQPQRVVAGNALETICER